MTSTGGAKERRSSSLGFFHIQENKIDGRPYYTNENGQHLYWLDAYGGLWLVIKKVCSYQFILAVTGLPMTYVKASSF